MTLVLDMIIELTPKAGRYPFPGITRRRRRR